jgi:putative transposase
MRFVFIRAHARIFRIRTMCRVLEVSRAGYYAWCARPLSERMREDAVLYKRVREVYDRSSRRYGSPRVHQEIKETGVRCGRKRVARLMRENDLRAKSSRRFRITTQSAHTKPVAENHLDRRFSLESNPRPNQAWAADITYIPTKEGWLYLAVILDLASRMVVGWSIGKRLDAELALSALRMALRHRRPRGGLHHSDRGVQYASAAYRKLLEEAGFACSMSRTGDCWDNAVVESFFATLTKELLDGGVFATRDEGRRALFEFIEVWYNRQRRHSTLGYRTPAQYEEELQKVS